MLDKYISKRKASPFWQLRVPVPRGLQERVRRTEILISLKTTDRALAERRALTHLVRLRAEWDALADNQPSADESASRMGPHRPDQIELEDAAFEAGYQILTRNLERDRRKQASSDPAAWAAYREHRRQRFVRYEQRLATGELRDWERIADRLIETRRWILPREDAAFLPFVRMIAEAFMDGLRAANAADSALPPPEPTSRTTKLAMERRSGSGGDGTTVMEMFEGWARRRRIEGKREDTIQQDRKVIELFAEFVGPKRSVVSIGPVDARDFRDTLQRLPPGFRKRKDYEGLDIRRAASRAEANGEARMSPPTVSKYMSTVSPFFAWLKQDLRVDANPFDGLHVKSGIRNPRPPFTAEQLNVILQSPLLTGFERDGKEHRPGQLATRDWRFWIPLLCLFTGARIGEVAQLRIEDLRLEQGWWFLFLREDAAKGQRIKNRKGRAVAVHPILEEVGFIDFVASARLRRPSGQLFNDLSPNDRGHIGHRPSRFWRDYLKRIGVKEGRDGFGSHSFRHSMADELRSAGYLDRELGPLVLGHTDAGASTTAGYGSLPQGTAKRLREMMEGVQFAGVSFAHLLPVTEQHSEQAAA